jgi:hypothetical protein
MKEGVGLVGAIMLIGAKTSRNHYLIMCKNFKNNFNLKIN